MNKTKFLSMLFLLTTANVVAQSEKFEYRFSIDIENAIEKDTVPWKYQTGASEFSFVGNYQKTRETWDKNGVGIPKITEEDSLYFIGFTPVSARDYIIERSKNEQIIIINEAHTYSNHRTFTHSLLQGLYDNGYRYLGLEALFDTIINERKYPIIASGYYTNVCVSDVSNQRIVCFETSGIFYRIFSGTSCRNINAVFTNEIYWRICYRHFLGFVAFSVGFFELQIKFYSENYCLFACCYGLLPYR